MSGADVLQPRYCYQYIDGLFVVVLVVDYHLSTGEACPEDVYLSIRTVECLQTCTIRTFGWLHELNGKQSIIRASCPRNAPDFGDWVRNPVANQGIPPPYLNVPTLGIHVLFLDIWSDFHKTKLDAYLIRCNLIQDSLFPNLGKVETETFIILPWD